MAIEFENYFVSITSEFHSLKNRVRDFISDAHWLTDGEWKESVLRSFLKNVVSQDISIGRGFIVTQEQSSSQHDLICYDSKSPLLFRDSELVFLPPQAVKCIIEVESKLTTPKLSQDLEKLEKSFRILRKNEVVSLFGIFAYETDLSNKQVTEMLKSLCNMTGFILHLLSHGKSHFIKYWETDLFQPRTRHDMWHAYKLEDKAPGYFLHNLLVELCPENLKLSQADWFPKTGKEISLEHTEVNPKSDVRISEKFFEF